LKWYSGVNRRVGHVFLQWVSGTTGFKPQAGTHEVSVWSPDIMKVIEHNHEYVTEAFRKELDKNPDENYKTTTYKRLLMKAFEDESTPERVGPDVDSLKETFREIIKVGGEYPDKRFR
jgi:hypothetical protein